MKKLIAILIIVGSYNTCYSQKKNIVQIMDYLRGDWDAKVEFLKTFDDLQNLCRNRPFRVDLIGLLDDIHHYDTTLYNTVNQKYYQSSDPEARATLDDIETLERDYTTINFRDFVHKECSEYNFVESNFDHAGDDYESEKKRVEIELNKYLVAITWQIDIIDEHAHHLNL